MSFRTRVHLHLLTHILKSCQHVVHINIGPSTELNILLGDVGTEIDDRLYLLTGKAGVVVSPASLIVSPGEKCYVIDLGHRWLSLMLVVWV